MTQRMLGKKMSQLYSSSGEGSVARIKNIYVPSDFPTLAEAEAYLETQYIIGADVADNDPTKTNTGGTFITGEVARWGGVAANVYIITDQTFWEDDSSNLDPINPRNINIPSDKVYKINDENIFTRDNPELNTINKGIFPAINELNAATNLFTDDGINIKPINSRNVLVDGTKNIGVDQAVGDSTFYATFQNVIDANYSVGSPTATPVGGAAILNGRLDLAHGDVRYIICNAASNVVSQQTGAIKFKYTPNYSGAPPIFRFFFTISNASGDYRNLIDIRHEPTGLLTARMFSSTRSQKVSISNAWSPVAGIPHELELNWDATAGATRLFVDGDQFGATDTNIFTRDSDIGFFIIGSNYLANTSSFFFIEDFVYSSTVQHTANYTPGYTLPESAVHLSNETSQVNKLVASEVAEYQYLPEITLDNQLTHKGYVDNLVNNMPHNSTASKQGGTTDEYFHTTENENDAIIGANSPTSANVFATMTDVNALVTMGFTGVISGGGLSINALDNTTFDVAAGSGYIVDNSNPAAPIKTLVNWDAKIGVTADYRTLSAGTFLRIDSAGDVKQQITDLTPTQTRASFRIGRISHFGRTVITATYNYPLIYGINNMDRANYTMSRGTICVEGNVFGANGTLMQLNKSAGMSERIGANYDIDHTNPNFPVTPFYSVVTFIPAYRDAGTQTTLQPATTALNPNNWDNDSGTLATVPANTWTIQTVLFFPINTIMTVFVLYGQITYPSFGDGQLALDNYAPEVRSDLFGGAQSALILMKVGTTDLAAAIAAGTAEIRCAQGMSGGGGSGVTQYWQKSGSVLSTIDTSDVVTASGGLKLTKTTLTDTFIQAENTNASINGRVETGLGASGNYATRIWRNLSTTPIYTTPHIIDKGAADYSLYIDTGSRVLFSVSSASDSGVNKMEVQTDSTSGGARYFKWIDQYASASYKTSIQIGKIFGLTNRSYDIELNTTAGITMSSSGITFQHYDNAGNQTSKLNSYRGFNGWYNSGFKVLYTGYAYVIKHDNTNNAVNEYISTTSTPGALLTEVSQGIMRPPVAGSNYYYTKRLTGVSENRVCDITLTDTSIYDTGIPAFVGFLEAFDDFSNSMARWRVKFTVISDPTSLLVESPFGVTKDTAGKINVYFEGGSLKIQNLVGSTVYPCLTIFSQKYASA